MLGPGVYSTNDDAEKDVRPQLERMSTDIGHLKLQYSKLKQRQQQAHIIIAGTSYSYFCFLVDSYSIVVVVAVI